MIQGVIGLIDGVLRCERRRKIIYAAVRIAATPAMEPITIPAIAPPDRLLNTPVLLDVFVGGVEADSVDEEEIDELVDILAARADSDVASKEKVVA